MPLVKFVKFADKKRKNSPMILLREFADRKRGLAGAMLKKYNRAID